MFIIYLLGIRLFIYFINYCIIYFCLKSDGYFFYKYSDIRNFGSNIF